jgi:hypothetical protein
MKHTKSTNLEAGKHYEIFVNERKDKNIIEYYNNIRKDHGQFKHWIFRGQTNEEHGLKSSLDRDFEEFNPIHPKPNLERILLREFKRSAHLYASDLPNKNDTVEWMSLMRHYGGPTRLLDWTYSFYIALFFAVEKAKGDSAVWALDSKKWNAMAEEILKIRKGETFKPGKDRKTFDRYFMKPEQGPIVYPVNPFRLNQRATIQQSIFMCPSHVDLTFEDNLISQQSKGEILLRKFIIRSDDRKGVLKDLYSMNITRATLFPGLEGYARSLKTYLLLPETWVE